MSLTDQLRKITGTGILIALFSQFPLTSYAIPNLKQKPIVTKPGEELEDFKKRDLEFKIDQIIGKVNEKQKQETIFTYEEYKKGKKYYLSKEAFLLKIKANKILRYPKQVYELLTKEEKEDFEAYEGLFNFNCLTEREVEMYDLEKENYFKNRLGHDLIIYFTIKYDEELSKEQEKAMKK